MLRRAFLASLAVRWSGQPADIGTRRDSVALSVELGRSQAQRIGNHADR